MSTPLRRAPLAAIALAALLLGPASAQQPGLGGFKHDSNQPIEIAADSLEVRQTDETAIFQGSVNAAQGDVRLQADRVEVKYAGDGAGSGGSEGAIRSMRATGDVFISNGTETAQGDWANYDVASALIKMGDDVILTQDGNALRGNSLEINLDTGQARMIGRVEGVFTPTNR